MKHYLVFDGKSILDYHAQISGAGTFNAPERDAKSVSIPGRNGDLTLDNGRYKNITVKYPTYIAQNYKENVKGLRNYLLSKVGYKRLEDTYHPDEYRMAKYSGGFNGGATKGMHAGSFELAFDCMPQRFLKTGENYMGVANGGIILNPTEMTALPLIKMTTTASGTHKFDLGGIEVVCSKHSSTIYIDCEQQEAWDDSYVNMNSYITLTHGIFPGLPAGESGLATTNCTIEIMPRWWRL